MRISFISQRPQTNNNDHQLMCSVLCFVKGKDRENEIKKKMAITTPHEKKQTSPIVLLLCSGRNSLLEDASKWLVVKFFAPLAIGIVSLSAEFNAWVHVECIRLKS